VAQTAELNSRSAQDGWIVAQLAGIMRALRSDVEAGYMRSFEELVNADVFADFIEMAEELVGKGYKDAAAVITGSVLEEHLRKLAGKHGGSTQHPDGRFVKADTAWLALRNKAAHGRYDEYDRAQVEALIRDVRSFMERFPA
jgi:hypothetical protein